MIEQPIEERPDLRLDGMKLARSLNPPLVMADAIKKTESALDAERGVSRFWRFPTFPLTPPAWTSIPLPRPRSHGFPGQTPCPIPGASLNSVVVSCALPPESNSLAVAATT